MKPEARMKSKCCKADIVYLPGNEEGECASCSSPSFRFADDFVELLNGTTYASSDFEESEMYFLLGMQRAIKETSEMDSESFEDDYFISL